jgi:exopolysaccharide production protein ExoZ
MVVVLHHALGRVGLLPQGADFGALGVQVFFVLSGFIMEWTAPRLTAAGDGGAAGRFLLKRVVRVVPLYWLATLVLAALMLRGGHPFSLQQLGLSLGFVPHFNPLRPGEVVPLLVPGWTLNYEMFFYACFGLSLLAGRARRPLLAAVLLGLVAWGWWAPPDSAIGRTYTSTLLLEFLAGMAWAAWVRARGMPASRLLLALPLGVLPFLLDLGAAGESARLAGAAVIVAAATAWRWREHAGTRVLAGLGDASYSIYLWHTTFLGGLATHLSEPLARALGLGPGWQVPVLIVSSTALSVAVYRLVERPMTRALQQRLASPARPVLEG